MLIRVCLSVFSPSSPKPPMLKMLLKERGLSITGNKKNLADRLLEFNEEAAL